MAVLKSIATGNWSDASTWALCDPTSVLDVEGGVTTPGTTYTNGSTFTPGAIDVAGICIKVASRSVSATGQVSVALWNATASSQVAGTEVTINATDIPVCTQAGREGLWCYFKFASPVTLLAATVYAVRVKSSVVGDIVLWRAGISAQWARQLVTTTTQAPAAGDQLIITGDKISPGVSNSYTVTMDETSTTDYGTGSTTLVSIWVGHDATLTYGTSPATNYVLRVSGLLGVGNGGTLNIGTTSNPIPRDSTAVLEFDCASDGQYGLVAYGGTVNLQGLSRSSGKNVTRCFLSADEAAGQTVLSVDTDTGWLAGDTIVIATTSTAAAQTEEMTLASNATATTLEITSGLAFSHEGNADMAAEVILLNRNVMIRSVSTTAMSYVHFGDYCVADLDYVNFKYTGSGTTLPKTGVEFATSNGSASINNCVAQNNEARGFVVSSGSAANISFVDCDVYLNGGTGNVGGFHIPFIGLSTSVSFTNCWAIRTTAYGYYTLTGNIAMSDCRAVGSTGPGGIYFNLATVTTPNTGSFSGNVSRASAANGVSIVSPFPLVLDGLVSRRNVGVGVTTLSVGVSLVTLNNLRSSGNGTNLTLGGIAQVTVNNGVFAGESGFNSIRAITYSGSGVLVLNGGSSGVPSGANIAHTVSALLVTATTLVNVIANDFLITEATDVASPTNLTPKIQYVALMNNNGVAGEHKTYFKEGVVSSDTTLYATASPSQRLTPSATSSFQQLCSGEFVVAVASGQSPTISVKVRESASGDGATYNGSFPRLILKANAAIGINADVVLDTATAASEGAWETLTGTTDPVTGDGVLTFIVDCDGTAGWINVDDWESSVSHDSKGMQFWLAGKPIAYNGSSGGVRIPNIRGGADQ